MANKLILASVVVGLTVCAVAVSFTDTVTAPPAQNENLPAPQKSEASYLPTPPQQNARWSHADEAFPNAVATIFEQGFADPRGLEYREIEIAVGNPWDGGGNPMKTHGWILPHSGEKERFAIAWNGLVYPALSVGKLADLNKDWAPDAKMPPPNYRGFGDTFEASSVSYATPNRLKVALLLRLGETEIVERVGVTIARPDAKADPYLNLATDWTWFAFERAVCAHERGDDRLALAGAQMLTRVSPLIGTEAKQRGFEQKRDDSNDNFPDRKQPYLPFLRQLPDLLRDSERRVTQTRVPSPVGDTSDITELIEDLQNVDARQMGQPGGVSLAQDARVQALVKRGGVAVEPLLKALENDRRLTRSVSFGRDFFRSRQLIPVSSAAYAALADLMRVDFKSYDDKGEPLSRAQMANQVRVYWKKMGDLAPAERFYETLKDDKAAKDQWMQAAANIVQPADVEKHGGWTTIPNRKPGQKVTLRGETLRDGRTPSVAQLLAKRSDDIAAIDGRFRFKDAGQMALYLADWDKAAAIPVLKRRLARAYSIGAKPNDILAFNGNPAEIFGPIIARMTLARARGGDGAAYDEYAAWILKADLNFAFGHEELQKPLIQGAIRPSIGRAIDFLFNDPKSSWSNVFGPRNGFWSRDFWKSPLAMTHGFRKQAFRGLADKSAAGTITFNARKDWNGSTEAQIEMAGANLGFRGSAGDDATPPPGEKRAFRVCDAWAYFYAEYQDGPKFQLFWPQKKRDAGVAACRAWLKSRP